MRRRLLAAPVFEGDEEKTRVAALLNLLLLATMAASVASAILSPFAFARQTTALGTSLLIFAISALGFVIMRIGYVRLASVLILFGLWGSFTIFMILSGGVTSVFAMGYVTTTAIGGLLLGRRAGIAVAEASVAAALGMLYAQSRGVLPEPVLSTGPGPAWLNLTANLVATVAMISLTSQSVSEALERAHQATAELTDERAHLQEVVAQRTRGLEQQAVQFATVADVGRAAASVLEIEALARQVVELVRGRFQFHYVALFLLDDAGEYAVLQAGTGEEGRLMKEQGHRLLVGGVSMVGAACAQRQPRVAVDVGEEPVRFDNPLLPATRSEIALPLIVGERVLGALDVQSTEPNAFGEDDMAVLQLVADQISVAVDNARKFSEEAELLEATSPLFRVSRRLVSAVETDEIVDVIVSALSETEADGCVAGRLNYGPDGEMESVTLLTDWNRHWASRFTAGVTFPVAASPLPLSVITNSWSVEDVADGEQTPQSLRLFLTGYGGRSFVNIPLRVEDRILGFVGLYRTGAGSFSPVSMRLYETLADQAAVAMERARLLSQAQARAERERLVATVSARMRETLDVETVLGTGIEAISEAVGLAALDVRLGTQREVGDVGDDSFEASPPSQSSSQAV
jgi:GAF domain-containing protein